MAYDQILLPMDGTLISEYVLAEVEKLAGALDNQVTLLHVAAPEGSG